MRGLVVAAIIGMAPPAHAGPWDRVSLPDSVCGASEPAFLIAIPDPRPFEVKLSVLNWLSRFRTYETGPGCTLPISLPKGRQPKAPVAAIDLWFETNDIAAVKDYLSREYRQMTWTEIAVKRPPIPITAEVQYQRLKADYDLHAGSLKDAPHIDRLIRAEILRLEPAAKVILGTSWKHQLQIVIFDPNDT